ncbi:hypothetical protein B0H63DRAFT_489466 [Podospora didyma]|uniref:CorA-like transporter domain-containing protein n=1 Tax=Podospora didyma TaxID=330526 RepID=A0AAE0K030_9PEZI|nr:hypothetical protein B0H63DRAFT_489466 [Podospora didyma]
MSSMDDRFKDVWGTTADYPKTMLRSVRPHEYHERNSRAEKLRNERDDLFDDEEEKLELWETGVENKFSESTFHVVEAMREHLEKDQPEPQIRHAFLESKNSQSPLKCSPEMLKTVFTYHQVEPSFLDAVHTFGDQADPKDLCLMSFRSHDTLTTPKNRLAAIPKLDRSGREIDVSYLLRAPEIKKDNDWPWQIRQAAVYNSFDVITKRSFWCTIKGNDEFNRRIKQSSPYLDIPSDPTDKTRASSYFNASLATHMVYLSWCDENWRQYINDIEDNIQGILKLARKAPIDDDLEDKGSILAAYPKSLRETKTRNSTMRSNKENASKAQSKTNTGLSARPSMRKQSTLEVIAGAQKSLMGYLHLGGAKQKIGDLEKNQGGPAASTMFVENADENSSSEDLVDKRRVLNEFRFSDVQILYTFSDRIRRAILTLTLNISVLQEMHAYYNRLLTVDIESFRHIKEGSKENLAEFLYEIQSLSKRLETRRTQLECLGTLLTEGNALYDGILQYRQLDISQRFQETAQDSAEQMHIMANKTRLETASMHVITVVTMIFLPATFVATFFQSGIFLWNNDVPEDMSETYRYRGDSFNLFVWISVPMMVATVSVWLGVFLWMKKNMLRGVRRPRRA